MLNSDLSFALYTRLLNSFISTIFDNITWSGYHYSIPIDTMKIILYLGQSKRPK